MSISWREVAEGVLVARTQPLDVNVTLVLGDDAALLVDTLSTLQQARKLASAIHAVTSKPLHVVNTHFHFDHCFGNAVFAHDGCPLWAHRATVVELGEHGPSWQRRWHAEWQEREPALAAGLAAVQIRTPDHVVRDSHVLDLGRRTATLAHLGHGHTAGDLVVLVQDPPVDAVDVVIAGDLVEEGGPPDFSDSYPLEWPGTLAALLRRAPQAATVVAGHGAVVDIDFARAQHADLSSLEWLIRDGHRDGGTVQTVASCAPYPADVCRVAVERGFAALDAHPGER